MAIDTQQVARFESVKHQVLEARKQAAFSGEVCIVAAAKKQSVEAINAYSTWARASALPVLIGENYVQEFKRKKPFLVGYDQAHLIGTLQTNKVAEAVRLFDVIQSVHSPEILEAILTQCIRQRRRLSLFFQVNISGDPLKAGFEPGQLGPSILVARASPWIDVQGLMTITRWYENPEQVRPDFQRMHALRVELGWPEAKLSMGMSSDFQIAIQEGATHVRVGTALFGDREPAAPG